VRLRFYSNENSIRCLGGRKTELARSTEPVGSFLTKGQGAPPHRRVSFNCGGFPREGALRFATFGA